MRPGTLIDHVSSGELLREEVEAGTELGRQCHEAM
jgi:hypothetical protein